MLGTAAATIALAAGCGSSKTTSTNTAATATTTALTGGKSAYGGGASGSGTSSSAASASSSAVLVTTKHGKLGTILAAGPKKLTVYLFEADKATASACTGACASAWPPVTTAGGVTAGGVTAGGSAMAAALGTLTRADGTKQVTYNGHPLYYFVKDKDDGDAYGQGLKAFGAAWYVLAPSGKKVDNS